MHCPDLCLISSLSRVLFIMPDSVTSVSWIHVLYVKGEHSGIQEQYCVVHVKQIYIIIAQGFCWMTSKSALSDGNWFCRLCVEGFFPFNHFYDDNDFLKCIEELSKSSDITARLHNSTKVFNPFDINEDNNDIIEYHGDIDPDICYFNEYSYKLFENCNYYTDDSFNKYLAKHAISNNSFSVAHLNIRSIPANFSAFLSFIDSLDHCFTVIGLSETWLNPSNVSTYGISGYNHVYQTRCTSRGGGVSLFVSEKIVYSEMSDYCMVNDYIESLFVKITNNGMAFVPGVVYRPPNSNVIQFNETLNDILAQVSHMPCYIMGDYNIDLLKHELHQPMENFLKPCIQTLYCLWFSNQSEKQQLLPLS